MTTSLDTIRRLRPRPEQLNPEWSAATLADILGAPIPSQRRRARRIVAGTAALVLATAGAAYATGLVPKFVTQGFGQVSAGDVTSERLIADMTLPDGRRVGVWTAQSEDGERCRAIAADWNGDDASLSSSFECGPNTPRVDYLWTSAGYPIGETSPPAYLVVFGERPNPEVTAIHLTGSEIDMTMPVNQTTGGFGEAVPIPPRNDLKTPAMTIEFLDSNGHRVASTILADR